MTLTQAAHYSGGFIVFGGWLNIKASKTLKCSFGGLGAGGWSGDGTLCSWVDWDTFYSTVKSFMYSDMFDPEDPDTDPGPGIMFFDKHSTGIGGLLMSDGTHCLGVGGGSVSVS